MKKNTQQHKINAALIGLESVVKKWKMFFDQAFKCSLHEGKTIPKNANPYRSKISQNSDHIVSEIELIEEAVRLVRKELGSIRLDDAYRQLDAGKFNGTIFATELKMIRAILGDRFNILVQKYGNETKKHEKDCRYLISLTCTMLKHGLNVCFQRDFCREEK